MSKLTLVFPIAAIAFLLLLFVELVPLLPRDVCLTPKDSTRWRRKDSAAVLAITLLYAIVAFAGLGDRVGVDDRAGARGRLQMARHGAAERLRPGEIRPADRGQPALARRARHLRRRRRAHPGEPDALLRRRGPAL